MTFEEFVLGYEQYKLKHKKSMRDGQCLMNYLYICRTDLYEYIEATDYDCFYASDKVDNTLIFLSENW